MKYTCTDPNCYFCQRHEKYIRSVIPLLPAEFHDDINRAGGWSNWRDTVLLENLRPKQMGEIKLIHERINQRTRYHRKAIVCQS